MTPPPIDAISRLNVHARAKRGCGEAKAIYAYKELAAHVLALDGSSRLRFVQWRGKCVRCNDGRFTHWDWDDGYTVSCRDCGGSGLRTLRFTISELPNGQAWHHPWEGRTSPGLDLARNVLGIEWNKADDFSPFAYWTASGQVVRWQDPGHWKPLQDAQQFATDELVPLLNHVEDWVETVDLPAGVPGWIARNARSHLSQQKHRRVFGCPSHSYQLDLGRMPGGCFVCGDATDLAGYGYGRLTPLFHWSLPVCKRHGTGPEKVDHPKDPPPDDLMTPDIRHWLGRHERVEELL